MPSEIETQIEFHFFFNFLRSVGHIRDTSIYNKNGEKYGTWAGPLSQIGVTLEYEMIS